MIVAQSMTELIGDATVLDTFAKMMRTQKSNTSATVSLCPCAHGLGQHLRVR